MSFNGVSEWLKKDVIFVITLLASMATSLTLLSAGVYWGGSLSRQVAVNTVRLENIERYGSPALLRMADQLNAIQRQGEATERRMEAVDDIVRQHLAQDRMKR